MPENKRTFKTLWAPGERRGHLGFKRPLNRSAMGPGLEPLENRTLLSTVSGTISSSTTWTAANSPYVLMGNIRVENGATLTIQSGVEVQGTGELLISDDGSGGTLAANGVTFATKVFLYPTATEVAPGPGVTPSLSGNAFNGGVDVAPGLAAALAGNTFPPSSTLDIQGGMITSPISFPAIAGVTTYLLDSNIYVRGGGTLAIASGVNVNPGAGNALYVSDDGSGGTLVAVGVTFTTQLSLGAGSMGTLEYDTFTFASGNIFIVGEVATVTEDDFSASKAFAEGYYDPTTSINLEGNYWGTTNQSLIRQNQVYDYSSDPSLPVIDIASPLAASPVLPALFVASPPSQSATAEQSQTFTLGTLTESNATAPFNVDVNWGDGSADTIFSDPTAGIIPSASHTYATDGVKTVTLTVTDSANHTSNSPTFSANVAAPGTILNGNGAVVTTSDGQVVRLTPSVLYQAGSIYNNTPANVSSFSATLEFRMTDLGGATDGTSDGADGIAFVVQTVGPTALGADGEGLGYEGVNNSVAVKFDTFRDFDVNDPSSNYLGIATNGDVNNNDYPGAQAFTATNFDDGNIWYAWIDYNGTTLQVRANETGVRPITPLLSYNIDVPATIGQDTAYVGLSSATGLAWENHDILNWTFNAQPAQSSTQLAFAQQPSNAVAGVAIAPPVTVDVQDAEGETVTADNSTVTLAITAGTGSGGATLLGTTSVSVVNGVATFSNLSLPKAGTYTLTATDDSLTAAISNSFNVTPAAPAQLAFVQPPQGAVIPGPIAPPVTVSVEDALGNTVTTDTSTVTIAIAPTPGSGPEGATLTGTTSVAAVNGVATFSSLSLATPGSYMLLASDGSLATATSASFMMTGSIAAVSGLGQPISDGATTIDTADGTDFGSVVKGAATVTHTFTITNNGNAALTLGTVSVPAGFKIVTAPAASVTPGSSTNFSVTLLDTAAGSPAGDVHIVTNDALNDPYTFMISGTVTALPVAPLIGAFTTNGPVNKGSTLTLTATGVTVGSPGKIKSVSFYVGLPGSGATFSTSTAKLLGVGKAIPASPGSYTFSAATATLPLGAANFFVRALDSFGRYSPPLNAATTINDSPPVIAKLTSTNKVVAADNLVTLAASGVADKYNTVTSVTFYWSPSGTTTTTTGAVPLATASAKTGWKLSVTLTPTILADMAFTSPGGSATFLAQAIDGSNTLGNIVSVAIPVVAQPVIGALAVLPSPIVPTAAVTFTASGITDADSTVSSVQFWLAPADSTALSTIEDTLLGSVTKSSGGNWVLTLKNLTKLKLAAGDYVVFARAQNKSGIWSEAVAQQVTVE